MSTCNQLDLQTLGSQPVVMPKNLRDCWLINISRVLHKDLSSYTKYVD